MPATNVQFRPRHELLTFEEITKFVRVASDLGVHSVRLTGGEPLVRSEFVDLVGLLSALPGIRDLALTTNGLLLADCAFALRAAGLNRLNISLDTLDEASFRQITRRDGIDRVIAGIDAAIAAGFPKIRINAIAIRGITERQVDGLVKFAEHRNIELRFIEFMPLDADGDWSSADVMTGMEVREQIERSFGPLDPAARANPSQPAIDFAVRETAARIGFISPVSQPFCDNCNRLRLTAEGQIRNCLFSTEEWDARALMRSGGSESELQRLIRDCVAAKRAGHGIDDPDFVRPQRAMYQIGG
jgi:cyclic pyranopterin phosphate synthase